MMKKRSTLRNTLAVGLAFACLALNASADTQINGGVRIKNDVRIKKVQTGQNARVHLGAVNLKNVNVGGDLAVNSQVTVGGATRVGKNSMTNLGSVQVANTAIQGPASFVLRARVNKDVNTGQGAEVMIGGVSINADDTSEGYASSNVEQTPLGIQPAPGLTPALPVNMMPINKQPVKTDSQITNGNNGEGPTSAKVEAEDNSLPKEQVDVTDKYNGEKRRYANNCVFFARQYVPNIPTGATSVKGRENGIKTAEKAGYGSSDMSKVRVGDAIHTNEGPVGHTAIVRGFDKNGDMILEEANYKSGRITVGRRLSPESSKVIGWIRSV